MANKAYEVITQSIIDALSKDTVPWRKEWISTGYKAKSLSSKKPYKGTNALLLSFSAIANGYVSPWWGTYKQIGELGGQVRKGEKSTPVVLWKQVPTEDSKGKEKVVPLLRYFPVFNADQVDWAGEAPAYETPVARTETQIIESAENLLGNYFERESLKVVYGGDRAYYSPSKDFIGLPDRESFTTDEAFYSTAFHEAGHSTGHKTRLSRDGVIESHYFGSATYSEEELVAELTAVFLCSETGIAPSVIENSTAYIKGWLKALQDDPKLVVKAAGRASKASDYIINGKEVKPEGEEE
jgi:antirestriction protein ArdC